MSAPTDVLEAKLAYIGAIAISWNYIEEATRICTGSMLCIRAPLQPEVLTRIHGFDGVTEILRKAIALECKSGPDWAKDLPSLAEPTIAGALEIKRHRDNIVHTMPKTGTDIGKTQKARGRIIEVSTSLVHLKIVSEHITSVGAEYAALASMTAAYYAACDADMPARYRAQRAQEYREEAAQLPALQKSRRALRRLPALPK